MKPTGPWRFLRAPSSRRYFQERSANRYTVYRVQNPLNVMECKAAPWFDEPSGAEQFQIAEPAFKLRQDGFIVVMANDGGGTGGPSAPCGSP